MLEQFKILTVTHKRTNLKQIGKFVLRAADDKLLKRRLEKLKAQFHLQELLYLSTCNRVMYLFCCDRPLDPSFAVRFFQSVNPRLSIDLPNHIKDHVHVLEGEEAIGHLLEVAASVDSLVIGERQILRQLREAFEQCRAWGLTGDFIQLAVQQAVLAAKAVYTQTRIGDKPVSVVSLAIQKMLKADLHKDARILMIGAGETNQLVAKFLLKHQFNNVMVFNRSLRKAEQLAGFLDGNALPLSKINSYKQGFDCLIICTASTKPILFPEVFEKLLAGETCQKIVIDLAVPHNVDSAVITRFPIHYIEIEGLRHLAKENLAFREQEITCAQELLKTQLEEFPTLLKQRQLELAMRNIPRDIKAVKEKALNEVFKNDLDNLDEQARELIEKMLSYMEQKCIGIPMKAAREAVAPSRS